jgi:hypothetical protein
MKEKRRCPHTRKGGGNLLPDEAALPHPRDDHPALAIQNQLHRPGEIIPQTFREPAKRLGLDFQRSNAPLNGIHLLKPLKNIDYPVKPGEK